jgi:hypothetical protein
MSQRPIFISHAQSDAKLVSALVDALIASGVVKVDDIFCHSLEGMRIPSGENFIDFIRNQLEKPKLVISIISTHYYESVFCNCELGAVWVLSHDFFPLLVPPLTHTDMQAVLSAAQCKQIDDRAALNELKDRVCTALGTKVSTTRFEDKRDEFIARIPALSRESGPPSRIAFTKFEELKKEFEQVRAELKAETKRADSAEALAERFRHAKDKGEIEKITFDNLAYADQFDTLTRKAKDALSRLPNVVARAMYCHVNGMDVDLVGCDGADIRDAIENDYLEPRDADFSLNESDPRVYAAFSAVRELQQLLESDHDEREIGQFISGYESKYGHQPKLSNKRLWNKHLASIG